MEDRVVNTEKSVSKLVRWLRACERHPWTPSFVVNFINFLRLSGDLERRFVRNPLRAVPEFAKRISRWEQLRYGAESRSNQTIADMLLFAVEYAVGASVEGDVAEFGTMKGRTARVLAAAMAAFRHKGRLHLFDSFEGMPESSPVDAASWHVKEGHWAPGSCQGMGPKALRALCRKFLRDDQIVIYEGWYKDTVKTIPEGTKFAVIHVDCDLYQSTVDALDPLFQRGIVSEGAVILFDDWNCNRAVCDLGERRAWRELSAKFRIEFSDGGDYSWGGHKFIVHNYRGLVATRVNAGAG
jgi:O-methyltransferase